MLHQTLAAFALLAGAQTDQPRDWGETLREDAQAMHDAIASSHPGTVNPDDPEFALRNEEQYRIALERAEAADSFADYFYALQHYVATFNDGHLSFGVYGATPDLEPLWPGFIARDDGNSGLVVIESEEWSGVPVGASIRSCDGMSAFEVGDARMGARFGRWELASQRYLMGGRVMVDTGDPYVAPIERCTFTTDTGTFEIPLEWRDGGEDFINERPIWPRGLRREVGMRQLEDGTYWLSLPSFNGDPESEAGRALEALVEKVGEQAESMRTAPAITFDLRGNGGGSSNWSYRMAEQIWGEGAFWRHPQSPMTVVWRASEDNIQSLRHGLERRDASGGLSEDVRSWFENSIAGLEEAHAAGDETWIIEPNMNAGDDVDIDALPYHPPEGRVFIITDAVCMSACLDAVDLWTRLGAQTVGRDTGADTIYMETRSVRMPSGLGSMSLPMKYYVNRQRGHNVSVVATYRFDGDMEDTQALENWITSLTD